MATNILKEKALTEDLELGFGTTSQTRGGTKVSSATIPFSETESITDALNARPTNSEGDTTYAKLNGNPNEEFIVSQGTSPQRAVQKQELDSAPYAPDIGDTAQTFLVEDATIGKEATNRDTAQVMINSSLTLYAEKSNVLEKDNTTAYLPLQSYHPATKAYVDEAVMGLLTFMGEDTLANILAKVPTSGDAWQTTTAGTMPDGTTAVAIDDIIAADNLALWVNMGPVAGPKGDTGDTGATGAAATLDVGTTTTSAPGEDADVTNSGDTTNAVFDFVIPRGEQGTQGIQGEQGIQGAASTVPGPEGPSSTITVEATITGAPGSDAAVVDNGTPGDAFFTFTIPRGDVGATGEQGGTGLQGDTGLTGPSSTIAVESTTTGTPGSDADVVDNGTAGAASFAFTIPRGDVGATGADSTVQGPQGEQGPQGTAGTGLVFQGYEDPAVVITLTASEIGECYTANTTGVDSDGLAVAVDEVMVADNLDVPSHWVNIGTIQGPQGATGSQGVAATISAGTTTTGTPGSSADVTNSGTANAAVFDFVIPRGDVGVTGNNGTDGADGTDAIAPTVAVGTVTSVPSGTAPTVVDSDPGVNVTLDFELEAGIQGTAGTNGTDGAQGTAGIDGTGWTDGSYDGATGIVTFDSDDGLGFSTTDLRGADGTDGTNGTDGAQGIQGEPGSDGANGAVGEQGLPGPTVVSTDVGNTAVLGTDSLLKVPKATGSVFGTIRISVSGSDLTIITT